VNRRRIAAATALFAFVAVGCSSDPPGKCEVTAEGNKYRSAEDVEADQLPGSPEIGSTYSAASGCVPGDQSINP
jgi:hypothetical protein